MMVVTGPMLCAGNELATAASKALGADMKFENISQAEAKRVLKAQSESDRSELQYLLDYYSLVREGKTNYIATTAFHDVTGKHPTEPDDFFRMYEDESRHTIQPSRRHHWPGDAQQDGNASVFFIGTATTVIKWEGFRLLTDLNFLYAGDYVHLGPGVNATPRTHPAISLDEDDGKFPQSRVPHHPVTTLQAARSSPPPELKDDPFRGVTGLDAFKTAILHTVSGAEGWERVVRITGMPGKHVPPGPLSKVNDFLGAVPPPNGWLVELGSL
ncbi:ATP-dependent bile acid permease [Purpureocillium lavendulum]|uniref:ATP-dependent bile acid permease n=1 Tax=Purpureocillium lavendulum TaxID=1247861 RepID=A0AB34FG44_9HYPO|nr:ATP-dependent bile acid permease [Purpureocillium lavendulum]